MTQQDRLKQLLGLGLRVPHYRDFMREKQTVGWLEVHSENYFAEGGLDRHVLHRLRSDYPVSLHGVGLALGSASDRTQQHLHKLKKLHDELDPQLVSEHLCWAALSDRHLNDLLPMPLTQQALYLMSDRLDRVQNVLGRQILIENVSSYVRFADDSMNEAEFLCALVKQSGCGLLLDLNNLIVNQTNVQEDAYAALRLIAELPQGSVQEIHLAGHSIVDDLAVDDHGSRVSDQVWDLLRVSQQTLGTDIPVLLEWDTEIPVLSVLLAELQKAEQILMQESATLIKVA